MSVQTENVFINIGNIYYVYYTVMFIYKAQNNIVYYNLIL